MQPCSNNWDETFQYLSQQFLAPELVETDPQQQFLTPPASDIFSPYPMESPTIVSVSTTFFPGAELGQSHPADLTLRSIDSVVFTVHTTVLLQFSKNSFDSLIPLYPISPISDGGTHQELTLPEDSHVLNIVLHLLYMIPCPQFCPSVDVISRSVGALIRYGFSIQDFAAPDTCLHNLILSRAPLHPIEFYAIAAQHNLYDLAVAISPHLMSFNLATLTDEVAAQMGPIYLRRLFFMHLGRNEALKRLLFTPPALHGPTPQCNFPEQKKLTRAWALAVAYLAWDARPDLSTSSINSALSSLEEHLNCQLCRNNLRQRIKQIIVEWAKVKRTI